MDISIKLVGVILVLLIGLPAMGQQRGTVERVEPSFWWTDMEHKSLQILLYGDDIGHLEPKISYAGVKLRRVTRVSNDNYLFLHLYISDKTRPGSFDIRLLDDNEEIQRITYELKSRDKESAQREGFDASDIIYLITPDRFANGDTTNDNIEGYVDKKDRDNPDGRHGGDIDGITQHLEDIREMGFTAVWLNPVLENAQPEYSYHGYSTTDFYKVDPRFGSNQAYREMVQKANELGMKVIMDQIVNHIGSGHWWMEDPPSKDWIHFGGEYVQTNHQHVTIQDPYASNHDRKHFVDGWFVRSMPDLNHDNPLLANYLVQNSIWWIEYSGIQGIRMDTYPYSGTDFMSEWTCRVMKEYPNFTVVGEEWNWNPAIVSFWQRGKQDHMEHHSCLPSLMDFPLHRSVNQALTQSEDRTTGWIQAYEMLSNDFMYPDPQNLVIFPDNHDMDRFFTQVDRDFGLWTLGITYYLTMRGVPQIYYGTEILMANPEGTGHGVIRSDYPGGWPGDQVNAFTGKGLTGQQDSAKSFISRLAKWRNKTEVIHQGELTHFIPENGVYVYFRYSEQDTVMVALNKNQNETSMDLRRFDEMIPNQKRATNIINGEQYMLEPAGTVLLAPRTPYVFHYQ